MDMDIPIICPESRETVWSPIHGSSGAVSRILSDFEELEILGGGAFGTVSSVQSKIDKQYYAVKKVLLVYDRGYEKTTKEVIAMARLSHPGVVKYHTCWLEDGSAGLGIPRSDNPMMCIQMERCFGSLVDLMGKELTDERIWDLFRQMVVGVHYIHSKGIRHGDLSPGNLFFDEANETIKIGDFGFATPTDGILGEKEVRVNSIYCAPELRLRLQEGNRYSVKSDVYSLGMILLELLGKYHGIERSELTTFASLGEMPRWTSILDLQSLDVISTTTNTNPELRPTTGQILQRQPWAKHHHDMVSKVEEDVTEFEDDVAI